MLNSKSCSNDNNKHIYDMFECEIIFNLESMELFLIFDQLFSFVCL